MKQFPKQVNIAGIVYRVQQVSSWAKVDTGDLSKDNEYYGIINYDKNLITICGKLVGNSKEETLFHEVLHGVMHATGTEFKEEGDGEVRFKVLARVLYDTIKRNKLL